ncbi:MAG: ImmA/IrrE family metallo-endopeptidase [Candidatus Margulisiibacteriota bacterium]
MASLAEISTEAEEIACKYNPDGLSPFPFENILQDKSDLKILDSYKLPENVSGAIVLNNDVNKYLILVNKQKPVTRQYFTTAHEIGHYFLHKEQIKSSNIIVDYEDLLDSNSALFRADSITTNQIEREANNFAAVLLMPEKLVRTVWAKLNNIEECAKVFNVSVIAMSIRLGKLGLAI